jgi:1,4-alpha-glucan branching enzyme
MAMTEIWGAAPEDAVTTFRVWAPNATTVGVQEFDAAGAVTRETAMDRSDPGYWQVDVAGATPGTEYLFSISGPGGTQNRIDPYAREVTNSVGHAVVYDEGAFAWSADGYGSRGWDELIVYELHVGTFDPDGTGHVGTLSEAATRLGYLHDLGVTAVELLPLAEFQGDQSWGYNPAAPFAVERAYGGPDGLKTFVDAAHGHGIAVILDVVYNHFGPSDLDHSLWRFDGWEQDNGGGIYFYQDWRAESGWGPRPDYGRPEVRQYIRDNVIDWLSQYRLDGLRFDATASIDSADGSGTEAGAESIPDGRQLLRECNDDVDASQPWKIRIAEDMRNNDMITAPTSAGGVGFPAQWDPDFVASIRAAMVATDDTQRSMSSVAAAIERRYGDRWLSRVVFTESHDADANGHERLPSEIDPATPDSWYAKKRSTLGAAVVFTSPGIPMLFQGQEFLQDLWFTDSRPVDWTNQTTHAGILALYRDLIALRRDLAGNTRGLRGSGVEVHHVNDVDKVLGYHRWDHGGPRDDTIVLLNCANRSYGDYTIGLPREGTWQVRLNSDWSGYDPTFDNAATYPLVTDAVPRDGMPVSGTLGIGPYSAVILSQDD